MSDRALSAANASPHKVGAIRLAASAQTDGDSNKTANRAEYDMLRRYLEMIRFSHTIFALPFALLAAVMAWRLPVPEAVQADGAMAGAAEFRWVELLGILLCMVFARSAAMAFNRLTDRRIDAGNPRTQGRHLVTGELTVRGVAVFLALTSIGFAASTALFLPNPWPVRLAIPVLMVIMLYSLTKRFTWASHFWLGFSLLLAPVCAWIAIRGELLPQFPGDLIVPGMIGAAVMLWVAGFDIIYACQDVDFDREQRLFSVPSQFGVPGALRLAAVCHAVMIGLLAAMPFVGGVSQLGAIYWIGLLAITGLLVYEHLLVSPSDLGRVNQAFFNVNAVVSIGLFVLVTLDLFV